MSGSERHVYEGVKAPSTDSITGNELAWMHLLRSILGDADQPPTIAGVLAHAIALIDDRREEVRCKDGTGGIPTARAV